MAATSILCNAEVEKLLGLSHYQDQEIDVFLDNLSKNVEKLLGGEECDDVVQSLPLRVSSALLDEFCALNWTGPQPPVSPWQRFNWTTEAHCWERLNKQCLDFLSMDGEAFYALAKEPALLAMAKTILLALQKTHAQSPSFPRCAVWLLRCLYVHQRLLQGRVQPLWDAVDVAMGSVLQPSLSAEDSLFTRDEKTEIFLEMGLISLAYLQYNRAEDCFQQAQKIAGLEINLTGVMGKRTRFQETDTAQLVLSVVSSCPGGGEVEGSNGSPAAEKELSTGTKDSLPQDVLLRDDTVLEKIAFSSDSHPVSSPTTSLQQAVVLGQCILMKETSPKDRLRVEELEAYVTSVLEWPCDYCVHSTALFLRSQLQDRRHVTVERAMLQLQELVSQYSKGEQKRRIEEMKFYCIDAPPHWMVERELANVLASLGSVSSALEVYERLQLWDDVIACLQIVGRLGKAESIIRDQLKLKETPNLWCLLGDVTKDASYYEKAWDLSGQRSSKAQKSLGMLHYRQKQYPECVECLRKSTTICFLQEGVWFAMGYAAGEMGDHKTALESFHNCVNLEPDHSEAWNNLAAVCIKMDDKPRAHRIFKEALKRSYDSWKIWENYLVVSMDIGAFSEVMTAMHRLIDLKDKYVDVEILGHMVKVVVDDVPDNKGNKGSILRKKLGELFGRVVSKVSTNPRVWYHFATLHLSSDVVDEQKKGVLELQKAQRLSRQGEGWDGDQKVMEEVFDVTQKYCQACRQVCGKEGVSEKKQLLSSAKVACSSLLTKFKSFESLDGQVPEPISDGVTKLESELTKLKEMLDMQ